MTIRTIEVKVTVFKAHIASQRRPGTPATVWERDASEVEMRQAKRILGGTIWHKSADKEGEYYMRMPGVSEGVFITMNQIIAAEQLASGERRDFPLDAMPIRKEN